MAQAFVAVPAPNAARETETPHHGRAEQTGALYVWGSIPLEIGNSPAAGICWSSWAIVSRKGSPSYCPQRSPARRSRTTQLAMTVWSSAASLPCACSNCVPTSPPT